MRIGGSGWILAAARRADLPRAAPEPRRAVAFGRRFGELDPLVAHTGTVPISNRRPDGALLGDADRSRHRRVPVLPPRGRGRLYERTAAVRSAARGSGALMRRSRWNRLQLFALRPAARTRPQGTSALLQSGPTWPASGVEADLNEINGLAAMTWVDPRRFPEACALRRDQAEVHLRGRARIARAARSSSRSGARTRPPNPRCAPPAGTAAAAAACPSAELRVAVSVRA